MENSKTFSASQEEVHKVETEMLLKLREIREAMITSSGGNTASSAELDNLKAENEALRVSNGKLKYRVKHLVSNMEQLLDEKA